MKIDKLETIAALESRLLNIADMNRDLENKKRAVNADMEESFESTARRLDWGKGELARITSQHINEDED